jgi:hypothetical protein
MSENDALHYMSSRSHILTVLSSEPEAKYSFYIGLRDKHITASVWVPISSVLYLLTTLVLFSSLFSSDPRIAVGSQFSLSRFQISISGKNVPTII